MRLDQMDVGINLSSGWSDNRANFSIRYAYNEDGAVAQTVYIEDLYNSQADDEEQALDIKFDALMRHFNLSTSKRMEERTAEWYIAFASGYNGILTTPEVRCLAPCYRDLTDGQRHTGSCLGERVSADYNHWHQHPPIGITQVESRILFRGNYVRLSGS
jgi:hypothetical protein